MRLLSLYFAFFNAGVVRAYMDYNLTIDDIVGDSKNAVFS